MKLYSIIFALALGLVACHTGTHQDPFSGKSKNIRDNIGKAINPKDTSFLKPDKKMYIDVDDLLVFQEGVKRTVKIDYRLIDNKQPVAMKVEAPEAMKIEFNPQTRELTWTPPMDFVTIGESCPNGIGGKCNYTQSFDIKVILFTTEQPIEVREKTVRMIVYRADNLPEIVEVKGLPTSVTEGDVYNFTVTIKDDSSLGTDDFPQLVLTRVNSTEDLTPFVSIRTSETNNRNPLWDATNNVWIYSAVLDLRNEKLTGGALSGNFRFGLTAISQFGKPSLITNLQSVVYAKPSPPIVTLPTHSDGAGAYSIEVQQNQKVAIYFDVLDRELKGRVHVSWLKNCSAEMPGLDCDCQQGSTPAIYTCHILGQVPSAGFATGEVTKEIPFEATSEYATLTSHVTRTVIKLKITK